MLVDRPSTPPESRLIAPLTVSTIDASPPSAPRAISTPAAFAICSRPSTPRAADCVMLSAMASAVAIALRRE